MSLIYKLYFRFIVHKLNYNIKLFLTWAFFKKKSLKFNLETDKRIYIEKNRSDI